MEMIVFLSLGCLFGWLGGNLLLTGFLWYRQRILKREILDLQREIEVLDETLAAYFQALGLDVSEEDRKTG
jgi:hypothetical protein